MGNAIIPFVLMVEMESENWGKQPVWQVHRANTFLIRLKKGVELLQLVKVKKKHNCRQH